MSRISLPSVLLFVALGAAGCGEPTAVNTSTPVDQLISTQKNQSIVNVMPPDQLRVIAVIDEYAAKYESAPNELQKSALWKERNKAIQRAGQSLKGEKDKKWVGILETMKTTSEGNAYIVVRIAPNITLSTANMELTDIGNDTLIKNGSKDYLALSAMPEGSIIRFKFFMDPEGLAITERGRMVDPNFLAKFSGITLVEDEELFKSAKLAQ